MQEERKAEEAAAAKAAEGEAAAKVAAAKAEADRIAAEQVVCERESGERLRVRRETSSDAFDICPHMLYGSRMRPPCVCVCPCVFTVAAGISALSRSLCASMF